MSEFIWNASQYLFSCLLTWPNIVQFSVDEFTFLLTVFWLIGHDLICYDLRVTWISFNSWQEYVSAKRMEYYQLNEFNIEQIMYLCGQLSMLNKDQQSQDIPDQVLWGRLAAFFNSFCGE